MWLAYGSATGAPLNSEATPAQLEALKTKIAELDRWLTKANNEKSGLVKELEKQEKDIAYISFRLRQIKTENQQLEAQLVDLRKQEQQQQRDLSAQKASLIAQLRALYRQGKQPTLKLLLDSNDPQDVSRHLHYFNQLNAAQKQKLAHFSASLQALKSTQQGILTRQRKLQQNREKLTTQRDDLKEKRASRQRILSKLDARLRSETARMSQLKADQQRLEALLKEVEQAIANLPLPSDAAPFRSLKTKLPWPTHGKVRERFGSRVAGGKLRSNGIRIATKDEQPVKAVHYGHVIFSDWLRGFGLLIIVDHGGGYMSLYGNNKSIAKETGDWVHAGETIAYSGDSGGKQESGLYFEIRKKGSPQNPAHWLHPKGNRP